MTLSRRAALDSSPCSALAAALPDALHRRNPSPAPLKFRIMRDGKQIGTHTVGFQRQATACACRLRSISRSRSPSSPPFDSPIAARSAGSASASWSSKSSTDENGERFEVLVSSPRRTQVTAPNGTTVAPATAFTTNDLWNPMALRAKNLVDAHHGGIVGIVSRTDSEEEIVVGSKPIIAARYRIVSPFFAGTIWYDKATGGARVCSS